MKVTFTPDGSSAIYLSEDPSYPLSCTVNGPAITSGLQVQEDNIVRATVPSRISRGNQVMECSFEVNRTHATVNASWDFCESHPRECAASLGDVKFYEGANLLATWDNCNVVATCRALGLTSITQYRIRGVPA